VLLGHDTQLSYSSGNDFVKRNVFNCLILIAAGIPGDRPVNYEAGYPKITHCNVVTVLSR